MITTVFSASLDGSYLMMPAMVASRMLKVWLRKKESWILSPGTGCRPCAAAIFLAHSSVITAQPEAPGAGGAPEMKRGPRNREKYSFPMTPRPSAPSLTPPASRRTGDVSTYAIPATPGARATRSPTSAAFRMTGSDSYPPMTGMSGPNRLKDCSLRLTDGKIRREVVGECLLDPSDGALQHGVAGEERADAHRNQDGNNGVLAAAPNEIADGNSKEHGCAAVERTGPVLVQFPLVPLTCARGVVHSQPAVRRLCGNYAR